MMFRVVIIENRNIIKEGLYSILNKINSNIDIVDYNTISSFLEHTFKRVDIVLIDYALLFSETKEVKHLRKLYGNAHFIGITNYICERMSSNLIEDMIYLNDNSERIRQIFENIMQLSQQPIELSDREKEILQLLAKGNNTKSIADSLYISPHTVATHKRNILKKTQKNSVVELVSFAYEHGILNSKNTLKQRLIYQ